MNKTRILLFLVIILAIFLRFWQLGEIPPGLNPDEASIGYTAYSLLETGRDEYGVKFPISFRSFGDWKLPTYIYATMPLVKIIGLNDLSPRLISFLSGVLTVILVYLLTRELFPKLSSAYSLLATFLLAISPWHIHFSRVVSEANLAVFFTTLGLYLFLRGLKKPIFLIFSSLSFATTLFTYHGNHIFTPIFIVGLILFFRKKLAFDRFSFLAISIFLILAIFIFSQTFLGADKVKISGAGIFSDRAQVYQNVVLERLEHPNSSAVIIRILHNRPIYFVTKFAQNYLESFSPQFLFIRGGTNAHHNIPNFGNLYLVEAPFLLAGLYFLLRRGTKEALFLIFWFLIAPIAASLTRDAPHSNRMFSILPAIPLIVAFGVINLINLVKNVRCRYLVGLIVFVFFGFNLLIYLDSYFIHFPQKSSEFWGYPFKEVVNFVGPQMDNYKKIIMSRPNYSPYIFFAHYLKYNPQKLQETIKHYPETEEGFTYVASLGNLNFRKIDWTYDVKIPNQLLIDWVENIPPDATATAVMLTKNLIATLSAQKKDITGLKEGQIVETKLLKEILLLNKTPEFYIIETRFREK